MADFTPFDTNEFLPGEPVTAAKALAWYENPIAIAEGATGAPLIGGAMAKVVETEEIGSFIFAVGPNGAYGGVVAGSSLTYAGALYGTSFSVASISGAVLSFSGSFAAGASGSPAGSWRRLGHNGATASFSLVDGGGTAGSGGSASSATLWQRVA